MITMAEEIRIGHLSTLYHTSFILKGSKMAEELGVRIRWRLFPAGPDIVDAFERGWLDLGYIGLPPAIAGIGRGLEIKVRRWRAYRRDGPRGIPGISSLQDCIRIPRPVPRRLHRDAEVTGSSP